MTPPQHNPSQFATAQERLWAGGFGDEYISRNRGEQAVTANAVLFGKVLHSAPNVKSIVELGCNIGLNLRALKRIDGGFDLCGYEINEKALAIARELKIADIVQRTVLDELSAQKQYDMTFTKGLLIHINPEHLEKVYANLYRLSKRYILVCEYYNPTPVIVRYRNNDDQLFKRDFAGELMEKYKLELIDYGFSYRRDNYFPQNDLTWFLLRK